MWRLTTKPAKHRDPLARPHWDHPLGLVAVGGDLEPETLLRAYRMGVFPWYDDAAPICWWSPDPRAVFDLNAVRPSRRLLRALRSGKFEVTFNRDFRSVMHGCAIRPGEGTWIIPEMIEAYTKLHRIGHAHSVETWVDGELVGGVYGVSIGGFFAGESMFHRVSDASKVALFALFERLRERGFDLFDTQFLTPHTERMGAVEIPRDEYMNRLRKAVARNAVFA